MSDGQENPGREPEPQPAAEASIPEAPRGRQPDTGAVSGRAASGAQGTGAGAAGGSGAADPTASRAPGRPDEGVTPPAVKVIDRRFWARGEASGEAAGETAQGERCALPTVLEELQKQVAGLRARERDLLVAFRQAQQDHDAFRQRLQRDLERRVSLGMAPLLRDLLEVADNLERAVAAAGPGAGAEELVRGVRQVLGQLQRLLASQGVEEVEVAGQPFDPEVAEAVEVREVGDVDLDGKVVEVARRGYRCGGQVLRPARVAVGRRPLPPAPQMSRNDAITRTGSSGGPGCGADPENPPRS